LTVVEAFACGTPVIASRLGAMQDLITDGGTGLHFTPGDPTDLASKAEYAWTHPEILDAMRKQARRTYETTYTAARNYEMLLETYERAIRNNEARRAGLVVDRMNPAWRFESHPEESYRVSAYSPKVSPHLASRENQDL
jgi:hypothetical protein